MKLIEKISYAAQLACLLELSAYPKPGNVNYTHRFEDCDFFDFLWGGVAIRNSIEKVAKRALKVRGRLEKLQIGKYILEASKETKKISRGNVNLGIILLLIPLSSAFALTGEFNPKKIRENINKIIKATSVEDALNFYKAIRIMRPYLPSSPIDAYDRNSDKKLIENHINLYEVMKLSPDNTAKELTNRYKISFWAYKELKKIAKKYGLCKAIPQVFLIILAKYPDSLIIKKVGEKVAKKVSLKAEKILKIGGVLTEKGFKETIRFDNELRKNWNELNPGSSADLICSAIMIKLMEEFEHTI